MEKRNRALRQVFFVLSLIFVFCAGAVYGVSYAGTKQDLNLSTFWRTYDLIRQKYVGEIDLTRAAEGAAKGLVESLNDPYSSYLPAQEKKSLDEDLSGQFEGIGAELTEKNGGVVVVAPIGGSPAEKAGIKAKDQIVAVDEASVEGLSLDEVVRKIRGEKGTKVILSVAREGQDEIQKITIVRDRVIVKSVEAKTIDGVGYIKITQFGDDTVGLFQKELFSLNERSPKAMIVDLRNNPGGYLNAVPPIAGMFIPPSIVVKEQYRGGRTEELRSNLTPVMPTTPLYILVNGGSASASEILAGALQDYKRATLVGTKTFGKGSVQDIIDLPKGAALRITIAQWLTPKDRAINKIGIEPDVLVEDNDETTQDEILTKVLELINR